MDQMRREILTWNDVDDLIDHLTPQFEGDFEAMMIITRGGIIPGGILAEAMDIKHILTAAVDFPAESGETGLYVWPRFIQFPEDEMLRDRRTLVVDDVWGSGRTITSVKNRVVAAGGYPFSCVLHFNPYRSLFSDARPNYFAAITDAYIIYPWEIDRGVDRVLLESPPKPHPKTFMPAADIKIALLGDVHANLPALEAVQSHARDLGVTGFWNIGDFVGYNAFPEQVIQRMRKREFSNIIGNYDLKVLKFPQKGEKWRRNKQPLKWLAFKWAYQNLSPESRAYLAALPEELKLAIGNQNFLLVHGSPASNEELLDKATTNERLRELKLMAERKYEVEFAAIICGHSHQAFTRRIENTLFINTGSVGRPGDGNPRTAYAILQIRGSKLLVSHYRLNYNIGRAVAANKHAGLPGAFSEMIIEGRDLDWILGN